jgi:ketosteroid isomerase-like protein
MPDPEPRPSRGRANEELIERFYAAIEQDRRAEVERLLDEHVVVRLAGRHEFKGTHRWREAALRFYRHVADVLGPGFRFPAHDVLADEQSIVVLPKVAAWRTASPRRAAASAIPIRSSSRGTTYPIVSNASNVGVLARRTSGGPADGPGLPCRSGAHGIANQWRVTPASAA